MEKQYILVSWPSIQAYMTHDRWNECIMCLSTKNHSCPDCTYAVPVDLYKEVENIEELPNIIVDIFDLFDTLLYRYKDFGENTIYYNLPYSIYKIIYPMLEDKGFDIEIILQKDNIVTFTITW